MEHPAKGELLDSGPRSRTPRFMGLGKYRARRDFAKTREPKTTERRRRSSAPIFVVQKHAASTLHYDFRLESDGVLKSWAVPKGPSLNPSDKRLAVMTEDHPLDYADFEGSIPEGQYGGGTVLVWDTGTWTPEGSVPNGLRAGKLSFELSGEKLHGTYSLVRLRKKDEQWLLIKRRDSDASERKVTETEPLSVLTGRSIEEVANDTAPARSRSKRSTKKRAAPRRAAQRRTRSTRRSAPKQKTSLTGLLSTAVPELATLVKSPPSGDEWVHEMKFDGYRVLAALTDGEVRLVSRNQNDWTDRFGAVAEAVSSLKCDSALLDGEVAVELADGRTSFQALQRALRDDSARLVYFVFDLLSLDGTDLRQEDLLTRKAALKKLLSHGPPVLRYSEHVEGRGAEFFRHACQLRLEGAVSKRADSTYLPGRSKAWVKTKCGSRQELIIGGYTYLRNDRRSNRIGALLLGVQDEEHLVYAGRVGTGFVDAVRRELATELHDIERASSPFSEPLKAASKGAHWVRPTLVAEIEFSEWTKDGRLRHPSFLGLRDDKTARDVVREAPAITTQAPHLTHPERVLFPGAKLTKQGLADYYSAIAERILPELEDRPVAYVRCPEGASKDCFFQRHPGKGIPATLRRVSIREGTGENDYLVLDSVTDLLALVQLGALELHAWGSRVDEIEQPDRLTFDLDPAPGVPWARTIEAAKLVHEKLAGLGLESFVKTTGGKGLHVVSPLVRGATWDECADFAKAFAKGLEQEHPGSFISEASKAKRRNRIFIDYLRNARGATTVVSYSPRARPHAPVATPLAWRELTKRLDPTAFDAKSVPRRVRTKADPWQGFEAARRPLP